MGGLRTENGTHGLFGVHLGTWLGGKVRTLAALAIGAVAAVLLARLMVIDSRELARVTAVLAVTAVFATLLVLIASAPLGRDARRLEATVRRIEAGDRQVRAELDRAD